MRNQGEAKENDVEVCGAFAGAESPIRVGGGASCWAIIVWHSWVGEEDGVDGEEW